MSSENNKYINDSDEFKTPRTRRKVRDDYNPTPSHHQQQLSSDASGSSVDIPVRTTRSGNNLSIVAEFDELMNIIQPFLQDDIDVSFQEFAVQQEHCIIEWLKVIDECKRMRIELDEKLHAISDLESKLSFSRKFLDEEKRRRKIAEEEKFELERQISFIRNIVFNNENCNKFSEETREKLSFLAHASLSKDEYNRNRRSDRLNTINEGNTTGSLLSDFSHSQSENDLDTSILKRKSFVPYTEPDEPILKKKRRSSTNNKVVEINKNDKVVATTTLTVHKGGPITATSVIESLPPTQKTYTPNFYNQSPILSKANGRQHNLQPKTVIKRDDCGACNERIGFGRSALKCKDCRSICHVECKERLPLPCIPVVNTPTQLGLSGIISDFTPNVPPYVPALIVHCTNEIEFRGLQEVGIYRVSASEREVKALKLKFLKGKGVPALRDIDVHVICATVKDFLRCLNEPLVTYSKWHDFIRATEVRDIKDVVPALYQVISEIPAANRDTLAYMMLHLQRVSKATECKMPVSNLSKVFAPTIIGYSCEDPDHNMLLTETRQQAIVLEQLINIPADYWTTFVSSPIKKNMMHVPSTDSLFHPVSRNLFGSTHGGILSSGKKKECKYFPTPPRPVK